MMAAFKGTTEFMDALMDGKLPLNFGSDGHAQVQYDELVVTTGIDGSITLELHKNGVGLVQLDTNTRLKPGASLHIQGVRGEIDIQMGGN
jgi:F0F1-type ATP synthase alpha subunit